MRTLWLKSQPTSKASGVYYLPTYIYNPEKRAKTMNKSNLWQLLSFIVLTTGFTAVQSNAAEPLLDPKLVERGRYLARVSGCNDCHTPGYIMKDGKVPEDLWLSGDSFGWRGAWGTTYGSNLRLFIKDMSETQWIEVARTLKRRPPMPWFNLNKMHEDDLRALYHFIRSMGDPGDPAPAYVPPDKEPSTPYAQFPSPPSAE
jgi:mono/diheme cytochrome c family protein